MSLQKFKVYFPFILIGFIGVMLVLTVKLINGGARHADMDDIQHATILSPPKPLIPFTLTDQNGNPFTERNLQGKWTFLFAGYTSCPDICPPTMMLFKLAHQQFNHLGKKDVQYILLSVDPGTDTPEVLSKFVNGFDAGIIGLTGSMDTINDLTRHLGLFHMKEEVPAPAGMDHSQHTGMKPMISQINHTGSILLLSPKGELYASFSPPIEMDHLVQTLVSISPP